ncbi:MAG: class I SAM-dependent methyltransferase [Clostridia bacterium]|nr:class I SAM-dependent methyltransferase [Clostridia bacterium]
MSKTIHNQEPYYLAYEKRYSTVFSAGATHWGFTADNPWLIGTLTDWVDTNNLRGRRVLEFACGEGAIGRILSGLGCIWTGCDIAPSAVEKAKQATAAFPSAAVLRRDCVREPMEGQFDAAIDVMGLHMIITDADRAGYLSHLTGSLREGAPVLFLHETYRADAYTGTVASIEEWGRISGSDYTTPQPRTITTPGGQAEVMLPLLPARAKNLNGYTADFKEAGLTIEKFEPNGENVHCLYSANFYTRYHVKA